MGTSTFLSSRLHHLLPEAALRTAMTLSDHVWSAEQGADEPGQAEPR